MKKWGFGVSLLLCVAIFLVAGGIFNSYETPEKCIKSAALLLHPLAGKDVASIEEKLTQVSLDGSVLYLYENPSHDVMVAELRLVRSGKTDRYAYQDLTIYRAGEYDEPGFASIENTTRGGGYRFGLYPEGSPQLLKWVDSKTQQQFPLTINRKDYVFQVERIA